MMFSRSCEYGIRATIYVALQSLEQNRASLKDIAREIESPVAFTAKILQQLVRRGIMDSIKGPSGGFIIEKKKIHSIKLNELVDALDGNAIYKGCALGLKKCDNTRPCPVHDKFTKIRDDLKSMLEQTSIYGLAMDLDTGLTYLKR